MRSREFIQKHITSTMPLTLKNINQLKHEERRRVESENDRLALMQVMYAVDDTHQFDNDKREIELDRREFALEKREAELNLIQHQLEQSSDAREAYSKNGKTSY